MNKIAMILVYFGCFKPSYRLFYESARRNKEIDWFIFTDNPEPENVAENVKTVDFTLDKFNALATEKLGVKVEIGHAYKLCDFKPMYGSVFSDYIADYDYWGFGDLDLVYGKLMSYLEKINYTAYDKINRMGHLTLLKNNPTCRELFKFEAEGSADWKSVINSRNIAFDERDLNVKVKAAGLKMHDGIFAADISGYNNNMTVVDRKTLVDATGCKDIKEGPKNYGYQLFVEEDGRAFRYYRKFFRIKRDEFAYIHFRRESPIFMKDITSDTYVVSWVGFYDYDKERIRSVGYFTELMKKYNYRGSFLKERVESLKYHIRKIFKK